MKTALFIICITSTNKKIEAIVKNYKIVSSTLVISCHDFSQPAVFLRIQEQQDTGNEYFMCDSSATWIRIRTGCSWHLFAFSYSSILSADPPEPKAQVKV